MRDRQTYIETDRQTDRQTDRRTDRQTDKQTDKRDKNGYPNDNSFPSDVLISFFDGQTDIQRKRN